MKLQILSDLYDETNRLFIAGSKFAHNDPRITKFIPQLEKMGEKAPVMKKLAEKYGSLVESDPDNSMETLLDAGSFLYAVLATQGATEYDNAQKTALMSGNGACDSAQKSALISTTIKSFPKTQTPHSRLRTIIDALTVSGAGRFEVIKTAFDDGLLNDFRLYEYLSAALDDKNAEMAAFICEKVIPHIGTAMIPYLLKKYDEQGKRGDALRLALLDVLKYADAGALALSAVENGKGDIAAAGIKILSANSDNEKYLLALTGDKKKEIREAALTGLVRMDSAEGKETMLQILSSEKCKEAIKAAETCKDPEYTPKILNIVKSRFDTYTYNRLKDILPKRKLHWF